MESQELIETKARIALSEQEIELLQNKIKAQGFTIDSLLWKLDYQNNLIKSLAQVNKK